MKVVWGANSNALAIIINLAIKFKPNNINFIFAVHTLITCKRVPEWFIDKITKPPAGIAVAASFGNISEYKVHIWVSHLISVTSSSKRDGLKASVDEWFGVFGREFFHQHVTMYGWLGDHLLYKFSLLCVYNSSPQDLHWGSPLRGNESKFSFFFSQLSIWKKPPM